MSQAVKRACDACHRRKVKCDGVNPCRNCSSAQLSCTYNAIPQKKGPKGSRAKVISELRETQRQTSLSAKVQNRMMNGIACPPTMSGSAPTPGLLTSELVKECAQFFFDNLYPQAPVLDRRQLEQQVLYMEQNRDAYCLLTSLCAFIMLQPGMSMPAGDPYNLDMVPGANIISSQLLLEECLRVRKGYEYLDCITLNSLATNFFLFGCCHGQEMHDRAWYYLREATTMMHMAGMDKEEHYMQLDASEACRRRRLFWLFFSVERAYAIQRQRPVTLQATINLPTLGDDPADPQAHMLNGFILLVNMFRTFDDAFLAIWNKTRTQLTSQYIHGLQKQLNEAAQSYACRDSNFHDLHTNQQWLKSTVWQLDSGVANGNSDDSMSFQYPVSMSRELLANMTSQFPVQAVDLLGNRLIEKLLEMSSAMTEYLAMQPASKDPFAIGPREHLSRILSMVAAARNGDYRFLPLLLNKLGDVLPRITDPMLQNAPENSNFANIDIFDGFGTAGMAQPPSQMHMTIDNDYDRKFSVEEYDKKYAMEMNGSTPESATHSNHTSSSPSIAHQESDMSGSFSSPSILSSGMEYSHNMNGFPCNPMNEMVMSPIGNSGPANARTQGHHMGHDGMQQRLNGMTGQNMHQQGINAMNTLTGMNQIQQRQSSFHMTGQSHIGEFRNLQRGNSDANNPMVGMNTLGTY
ncbi:C6 zinc finger domain containing protein [Metarhizium album ARSEF 1941]|uniref:C6 zinc finger domain containing protein n=1 Tax=Metarhizium album (strain ARSEF 1941) TaxID=1081103 RepID=A0A0B2WTD9_METAS|nr:C6 zinc finger domain containing protein [Metarhizium album ARSEF 1941]KHN97278.1 C6 zinc finger domain containing protein [Metarhizium album ARSEF 1941]